MDWLDWFRSGGSCKGFFRTGPPAVLAGLHEGEPSEIHSAPRADRGSVTDTRAADLFSTGSQVDASRFRPRPTVGTSGVGIIERAAERIDLVGHHLPERFTDGRAKHVLQPSGRPAFSPVGRLCIGMMNPKTHSDNPQNGNDRPRNTRNTLKVNGIGSSLAFTERVTGFSSTLPLRFRVFSVFRGSPCSLLG